MQTLSRISQYYSSGSICAVVKRTLTSRRVERLARKPFSVSASQMPKDTPLPRTAPPAPARAHTSSYC